MPRLVALLGILIPRIVLLISYLLGAFSATFWGVVGWIFLPYTTLSATFAFTNKLDNVESIFLMAFGL